MGTTGRLRVSTPGLKIKLLASTRMVWINRHPRRIAKETAYVGQWPLDHLQAHHLLAVTAAFDSEGEFFRCTLHSVQ